MLPPVSLVRSRAHVYFGHFKILLFRVFQPPFRDNHISFPDHEPLREYDCTNRNAILPLFESKDDMADG